MYIILFVLDQITLFHGIQIHHIVLVNTGTTSGIDIG